MNTADLLPCPFCGGDDHNWITLHLHEHYISCIRCGAIGPTTREREEAPAAWNNRQQPEGEQ